MTLDNRKPLLCVFGNHFRYGARRNGCACDTVDLPPSGFFSPRDKLNSV